MTNAKIERALATAIPLLAAFLLFGHLFTCIWTFPQADTFWPARLIREKGYWLALLEIYQQWSGRMAAYMLIGANALPGVFPYHTQAQVFINLAIFIVIMVILLWRLEGQRSWMMALCDTAFLMLLLPSSTKQQVFYWSDASPTYLTPVWLMGLLFLWNMPSATVKRSIIFLLGVVLGLFNEAFTIAALIGLITAGFFNSGVLSPQQRRNLLIIAGGITIGFLIDFAAPGNYARLQVHAKAGMKTLSNVTPIAYSVLMDLGVIYLPFFIIVLGYGMVRTHFVYPPRVTFCLSDRQCIYYSLVLFGMTLLMLLFLECGYAGKVGETIPYRILFPAYILTFFVGLAIAGWLADRYKYLYARPLADYLPKALTGASLFVVILSLGSGMESLLHALSEGPMQRQAAIAQLNEAFAAQHNHQSSAIVEPIPFGGNMLCFKQLRTDPDYWSNQLFARYIGLRQVRAAR